MKLSLEFIRRPKVPWIGIFFLCITLSGTVFQLHKWDDLRDFAQENQEKIAHLRILLRKKHQSTVVQNQLLITPTIKKQRNNDKKIISLLNYPWNRVFSTIEQTKDKETAILFFAYDQLSDQTQLTVESLDVPALIRFTDALNQWNDEDEWYIANYQIQSQNIPPTVKGSILRK